MRYTYQTMPTDRRYTGQHWVEGIGLYDYRARWYDPALARFVSADTVVPEPGNPQDLNRYAYVRGNPLIYSDPGGHMVACMEGSGNGCTGYMNGLGAESGILSAIVNTIFDAEEQQNALRGYFTAFPDRDPFGDPGIGGDAQLFVVQTARAQALMEIEAGKESSISFGRLKESVRALNPVVGWVMVLAAVTSGVPSPNGRLGGAEHQIMVQQTVQDINNRGLGLEPKTEYRVMTPGGRKPYRFADVAALDADGTLVELHQVGQVTQGGLPVGRERDAMMDIFEFGDIGDASIQYRPYYK